MALCKEKNLPPRSALLTQSVQDDNRVRREEVSKVKTKINRLKRPKRAEGPAESQLLIGTESSCKDVCSEPTVDQKFSSNNLRAQPKPGAQLPSKLHPLSSSLKQTKLQLTSSKRRLSSCTPVRVTRLDPDIIDLCGDDGDQPDERLQKPANQGRGSTTNINEPKTQVQPQIIIQSVIEEAFHSSFSAGMASQHREPVRSDRRLKFTDQTYEELWEQIRTQNPNFPVRRFFSLLMKRRCEFENDCSGHGDANGAPEVPPAGKRTRDEASPGGEQLRKRRRPNPNLVAHTECGDPVPALSGSRLGMSRRNARQESSSNAEDEPGPGETKLGGQDVLWTEKYRPRCSDEVVGNSAAVRKLQSWLKEWRVRADVEERRKRREERRMQEESNDLSDCGDFEGDPMMGPSSAELCNTMLIVGPVGVGKTAAVYACAHELGFKVFEVNSSSVRSGHLVLSQLRESTQSHQVGAPHKPAAASRKEAPVKSVPSLRRSSLIPRGASRKKNSRTPSLTLRHFFKNAPHPVKSLPESGPAPDTQVSADSEFKAPVLLGKDEKHSRAPISLVLFEEVTLVMFAIVETLPPYNECLLDDVCSLQVDIIFDDDVGFLSAIKTLMSTTKRPLILTTNDPSFSRSFGGHFEEIRFKPPSKDSIRSFLQCVCVVESARLDPELIDAVMHDYKGDVRRGVLELELWVRSGAGNSRHTLHRCALTCNSYAELESTGCMDLLVDSWRNSRGLLYSNLELLLAPPTPESSDPVTSDLNDVKSRADRTRPRKLSRRKQRLEDSESRKLEAVAQFLGTMSFLDSYLVRQESSDGPGCTSGATISHGLLEEEEEGVTRMLGAERRYEMQAMLEGLGFQWFRTGVCGGGRPDENRAAAGRDPFSVSLESPDLVRRILCSKAFQCHANKTAVVTEYLPMVRFMCSVERARHRNKPRFSHYLRDIGLQLPKSVLTP